MSRLSFRAKLLLVLFVPFLALVVVAAAGLSDRFTALHAQEQYGDLSAPLRSLDAASRALQDESVVSSWYVAGTTAPPTTELTEARARTDAAVRDFRANEQAFADAGLGPAAGAGLAATNKGLDGIPEMRGQVDARAVDAATTRNFFLGVDQQLLDFGERVARDLASADVSASLTRVFALERARNTSWPAKRACTSRCSPARRRTSSASGSARRPWPPATATSSPTPRPTPSSRPIRA